jgi:hypothetical protein
MEKKRTTGNASNMAATRWLLCAAQLMALTALGFGLQFLVNTTGGTLFLFSSMGPLLMLVSCGIVIGVAIAFFRKRHSLFDFETIEPGQIVFRQGDAGDCAYFVQSGEVEVVRADGGGEVALAKLRAGQYFGEMALLSSELRNATVRAVATTKLARLGKRNFLTMLGAMPAARQDILKTAQERALREGARPR